MNRTETLCWSCQRAVPDPTIACSWSRRFKPVPGWDAEETQLISNGQRIKSYCVYDCPMFLRDDNRRR